MYLQGHIDFRDANRASDVIDAINALNRSISFIFKLLLLPFLVPLFLVFYVLVQTRIKKVNRGLDATIAVIKSGTFSYAKYSHKEISTMHNALEYFFNRYGESITATRESKSRVLLPFRNEFLHLTNSFAFLRTEFNAKLFVDASNVKFSKEDQAYLEDFFGPEEDYAEDTYKHLAQ